VKAQLDAHDACDLRATYAQLRLTYSEGKPAL
jgi:hypothetical protein